MKATNCGWWVHHDVSALKGCRDGWSQGEAGHMDCALTVLCSTQAKAMVSGYQLFSGKTKPAAKYAAALKAVACFCWRLLCSVRAHTDETTTPTAQATT